MIEVNLKAIERVGEQERLSLSVLLWKQPRCPSADEWIRKLWYIYTMEYYSAIKTNIWISSNEVDETGTYYTEWSKPERKTPIQYANTYIWNLDGNDNPVCETLKETQMYRTVLWTTVLHNLQITQVVSKVRLRVTVFPALQLSL